LKAEKPFEISKKLVFQAYQLVKSKGGAAGIDDKSIADFERKLKDNLYRLWNRLSSGTYFPPPVKGVPIPKKLGGERLLGVPTVSDRIAQTVVKMIIEPMLEPVFDENSYGYRPGKSAHDAIEYPSQSSFRCRIAIQFTV
jgi:RNA-directed DNA polymerase